MANQQTYTRPAITVFVALVLLLVALPSEKKSWTPGFLRNTSLHFGLDLAGGTQLDFRISERELDEQIQEMENSVRQLQGRNDPEGLNNAQLQLNALRDQKRNLVEAIRTVLERRINALGVSEATITPSYIGNEKHLLVECPGVVDVQQCIETVGKTINLEFKEEFTEATEEFEQSVQQKANAALARVRQSGDSLNTVAEDLSSEIGVLYQADRGYFEDQVPTGLEPLWNAAPGSGVQRIEGSISVPRQASDGTVEEQEVPGIFLVEVTAPRSSTGRLINEAPKAFTLLSESEEGLSYDMHDDRELTSDVSVRIISTIRNMQPGDLQTATMDDGTARVLFLRGFQQGAEKMEASHILIAYEGAVSAPEDIPRTKEEAQAFATDLLEQLRGGANFEQLAQQWSNGPSGAQAGSLGEFGRGEMVPSFEAAAYALNEGEYSELVETQFGFHIIRSDKAPRQEEDSATYDELIVTGDDAASRAQVILTRMQNGEIKEVQEQVHLRTLFFSLLPTGWKDTALDGKHFRSATVTLDPVSNLPIVQITFDEEGAQMFQELTKNNVGKRIAIFVGGQLISAPTVQGEISGGTAVITGSQSLAEAKQLSTDLNTGAIPAPIFLNGQRTVEATLGASALQTSLQAALIGIVILMTYMIVVYRVLGLLANIALSMYAFIFFAFLKMPLFLFSSQHIVLTLAGMAGIILSIGMAVDANVLIFERMKEELRKGKHLSTAARTGFERAWPSIRDGNMSTFITCSILFLIGTSIVRGFAVTLGIGVLLSMFSAIVVTRWLLEHVAASPLGNRSELFGVKQSGE